MRKLRNTATRLIGQRVRNRDLPNDLLLKVVYLYDNYSEFEHLKVSIMSGVLKVMH